MRNFLANTLDLARAAADELIHHLTAGALVTDELCPRGPACGNFGRDACAVTPRCNLQKRCLAAEELGDGKQKLRVGAPAARPLCDTCERAVANTLKEVRDLYLDLENAMPDRTGRGGRSQVRSEPPGSPMLTNPRAVHLQETIHQLLTAWEDFVRDTAGLSPVVRQDEDPWEHRRPAGDRPRPKRRARPAAETVAAAALLGRYLTAWIVHAPVEYAVTRSTADPEDPKAAPDMQREVTVVQAGWQAAVALLDWKGQVRHALGVTKLVIQRDEPCMYCEVKAVVEENGADRIWCEACQREWTRDDYHAKVRGFQPYLRKLAKKQPKPDDTAPADRPAAPPSTGTEPLRSAGGLLHPIMVERVETERMSRRDAEPSDASGRVTS